MPMPNGLDREQLLSILQSSEHRLEYLTRNDWALLVDRAKKVTFEKEEMLIKKGKQTKVLYLLVRGRAKIEAEFGVRIAQIGPGQICGEMAFLENGVASATAIAEQEVEACAIDWSTLSDLFELYPHIDLWQWVCPADCEDRSCQSQTISKRLNTPTRSR